MDSDIQEIKEKMDELTEMVKENGRMTKILYRKAKISTAVSIVRWVVIIGVAIGAFVFLQPYLEKLVQTYESISKMSQTFSGNGTSTMDSFVNFFKNL